MIAAVIALCAACNDDGKTPANPPALPPADERPIEERVRDWCAQCHKFPQPGSLPAKKWAAQVRAMYDLATSDPRIEPEPDLRETIRWFEKRAPRELRLPRSQAANGPGSLVLRRHGWKPPPAGPDPAVALVHFAHLADADRLDLVMCDMRHGFILRMRPSRDDAEWHMIARAPHPGRAIAVDLNEDGNKDLLVADLATLQPGDTRDGKVLWYGGKGDGSFGQPLVLLAGVGRVADVHASDIDADGDTDIVVGVFGSRKTGKLLVLANRGKKDKNGMPLFDEWVLDNRPGAIDTPVVDMDGDGQGDVVALMAQEIESVIVHLYRGPNSFERRVIFEGPHPGWGASGMEVVDVDGDGDLDVVVVNGDTTDASVVRPDHGVTYLENRGEYPFFAHDQWKLPAAYAVRARDMDADGDIDIVAATFRPQETDEDAAKFESLIWLEQTEPGEFARFSLESGNGHHMCLDVADYDGDGDMDIVTGNATFHPERPGPPLPDWISVFENVSR